MQVKIGVQLVLLQSQEHLKFNSKKLINQLNASEKITIIYKSKPIISPLDIPPHSNHPILNSVIKKVQKIMHIINVIYEFETFLSMYMAKIT